MHTRQQENEMPRWIDDRGRCLRRLPFPQQAARTLTVTRSPYQLGRALPSLHSRPNPNPTQTQTQTQTLALALALAPALALALALSLSLSRGEEAHVFDVGCCLGGRFQEDQAVLLRELLPFLRGDGAP